MYLLNQFMEDCRAMQENNQPFHYSWLIVLMAFVTWKEPKYTQFLLAWCECRGVHYANLWANANPKRKHVNNQVFYTYYQQPSTLIDSKPKITKDLTDLYKKRIRFMANMHRIYIKPQSVKDQDWYTGAYRMEKQDIEEIIKEWP